LSMAIGTSSCEDSGLASQSHAVMAQSMKTMLSFAICYCWSES
jgi:hypothetical protein